MFLRSFLLLTVLRIGLGSPKGKEANRASILQELLLRIFTIPLKMTLVVGVSAIHPLFSNHEKCSDLIFVYV